MAHVNSQVELVLLCYLAVAHHGRGRGEWMDGEFPGAWVLVVDEVVNDGGKEIERWWKAPDRCGAAEVAELMERLAGDVLKRLYPDWRG